MSFQVNATQTTVSIVGSVAASPVGLGSGQTLVTTYNGMTGTANNITLYTVPASKKFTLCAVNIGNGGTASAIAYIKTNAAAAIIAQIGGGAGANDSTCLHPPTPIYQYTAGQTVVGAGTNGSSMTIFGYIEDA